MTEPIVAVLVLGWLWGRVMRWSLLPVPAVAEGTWPLVRLIRATPRTGWWVTGLVTGALVFVSLRATVQSGWVSDLAIAAVATGAALLADRAPRRRRVLSALLVLLVGAPAVVGFLATDIDQRRIQAADATRVAAIAAAESGTQQRREQIASAVLDAEQQHQAAVAERDRASADLAAEITGVTTGVPGCGPACRVQQEALATAQRSVDETTAALETTRARADSAAAALDAEVRSTAAATVPVDSDVTRLQALVDVVGGHTVVWFAVVVLVGVLYAAERGWGRRREDPGPRDVDTWDEEHSVTVAFTEQPTDRLALTRSAGAAALVRSRAAAPPDLARVRPSPPPVASPPTTVAIAPGEERDRADTEDVDVADSPAWLHVLAGGQGSHVLGLTVNTIGRSDNRDVVIDGDTVSRHHCTIVNRGQRLLVQACDTPNGTFVNDRRLTPGESVVIRGGDVLGLGRSVRLELFVPEDDSAGETALAFRSAGATDAGRREENQDRFHDGERVIAVADGVGGRPGGDVAALLAVDGVRDAADMTDLTRAVREVNLRIRRRGDHEPIRHGLASTLDAAVISHQGGQAWVHGVHVGDGVSLLQRPRRTEVVWLTRAHTLGAELAVARSELASQHPDRERLMRAVGFAEDVNHDQWQERAEVGQRYVIASDGLLEGLGTQGLQDALADLRLEEPTTCAAALLDLALAAGAADNVTVIVADVVDPTRPAAPALRPRKELQRGRS